MYDWDGKKVNAGGVTTFQRHAVVSENRLTPAARRPGHGCRRAARLCRADRHGRGIQRARRAGRAIRSRCSAPAASASMRVMAAALAGRRCPSSVSIPKPRAGSWRRAFGATHVDRSDRQAMSLAEIKSDRAAGGRSWRSKRPGVPAVMAAGGQRHAAAGRARGRHRQRPARRNAHRSTRRSSTRARACSAPGAATASPTATMAAIARLLAGRFPVRELLSEPYRAGRHQPGAGGYGDGHGRPAADRHVVR